MVIGINSTPIGIPNSLDMVISAFKQITILTCWYLHFITNLSRLVSWDGLVLLYLHCSNSLPIEQRPLVCLQMTVPLLGYA